MHSENNILRFCAALCLAFSHWRVLTRIWTWVKQVVHPRDSCHLAVLACTAGSSPGLPAAMAVKQAWAGVTPGRLSFRPGHTGRFVSVCF